MAFVVLVSHMKLALAVSNFTLCLKEIICLQQHKNIEIGYSMKLKLTVKNKYKKKSDWVMLDTKYSHHDLSLHFVWVIGKIVTVDHH